MSCSGYCLPLIAALPSDVRGSHRLVLLVPDTSDAGTHVLRDLGDVGLTDGDVIVCGDPLVIQDRELLKRARAAVCVASTDVVGVWALTAMASGTVLVCSSVGRVLEVVGRDDRLQASHESIVNRREDR